MKGIPIDEFLATADYAKIIRRAKSLGYRPSAAVLNWMKRRTISAHGSTQ